MNKKLKEELKKVYEAPPPPRKYSFLRQIDPQPMNMGYMLYTQISYISKLEWIFSALLFGMIVFMSWFLKTEVFGPVLTIMPFLAAAGVSESMRSVVYGMDELELAARFSLKSIVLARMSIIGIENMVLVLFAALFMQGGLLQTMLYLLVPYLITVYGSLWIVRNISGRDGLYVCIGYSAMISAAVAFSSLNYAWIYQEQFLFFWMAAVIVLLIMDCKESKNLIKNVACY